MCFLLNGCSLERVGCVLLQNICAKLLVFGAVGRCYIQYAFVPPLVDKLLKMGATKDKSIKEIKRFLNKIKEFKPLLSKISQK